MEQELKDCVLDEFSEIIESVLIQNLGGMNFAQKLSRWLMARSRQIIMNRIAPVRDSLDFMDDIKEMDSGQIYNVLRFEQPQTIAFVLANVDPDKASEVLQLMPPNVQEQVIERVGSMETTPMDQIEVVATTLGSRVGSKGQSPQVKTGGVKSAADLLNWFDKEEGKELLKSIEKRNPKLGGSIRQRMFRFEDLVRLSPGDVAKITKEVDQDDLVIALKNASPELKKSHFLDDVKERLKHLKNNSDFWDPSVYQRLRRPKTVLFKSFANSKRMRKLFSIPEAAALSFNKSITFPVPPSGFKVSYIGKPKCSSGRAQFL